MTEPQARGAALPPAEHGQAPPVRVPRHRQGEHQARHGVCQGGVVQGKQPRGRQAGRKEGREKGVDGDRARPPLGKDMSRDDGRLFLILEGFRLSLLPHQSINLRYLADHRGGAQGDWLHHQDRSTPVGHGRHGGRVRLPAAGAATVRRHLPEAVGARHRPGQSAVSYFLCFYGRAWQVRREWARTGRGIGLPEV